MFLVYKAYKKWMGADRQAGTAIAGNEIITRCEEVISAKLSDSTDASLQHCFNAKKIYFFPPR